jgi:hypothetical protein
MVTPEGIYLLLKGTHTLVSHVILKAGQDVDIMHTPVLAEREQSGDYQVCH